MRMSIDEPPARRQQRLRIVVERRERAYRLASGLGDRRARRTRHVAKPLDGMHGVNVTGAPRRRGYIHDAASAKGRALRSGAVASAPDASTELAVAGGESRPLSDWLTTFPLVLAVIDPYTHESAWLLDTIRRIFANFSGADCRVAWLVTADTAGAEQFLGPLRHEFLTYVDPDRVFVKALDVAALPALVALRQDGSLLGAAEGWDPPRWRDVTAALAQLTSWSKPVVPAKGDPVAYPGTPPLG